jgi:primary-amine oxidase
MATVPHPLRDLSIEETRVVRDLVAKCHPNEVVEFREIGIQEPPKAELLAFLELEHSGQISSTTPRPARLARCYYDTINSNRKGRYNESVVDLDKRTRIEHEVVSEDISPALTV